MSAKRIVVEAIVWLVSRMLSKHNNVPEKVQSIFILRNNDLGDLLIVTPLFEALRRRFPDAYIVAGVGQWNVETIKLNPYLSEILSVNAPWNNKFISNQNWWDALNYIAFSPETQELEKRHFDVGIDVLGSYFGSLLMVRAGIPYRLGVRGYAGGHSAVQQYVEFNEWQHVGRAALGFAELLGATELPKCRPQIFLSQSERQAGERRWSRRVEGADRRPKRIVIGPGGGFAEKCWPLENYAALVKILTAIDHLEVIIVGGKQDREAGRELAAISSLVQNLAGDLTIRETFALVAAADLAICNSSMLMHAAAAFSIPTVVLLGDCFTSAKLHTAQWGYDGTCHIFGKEGERQEIYTPTEVMSIVCKLLEI
ncbi:glycosyltransferase family 9 protein [Argonema antarcticum]|uniref:glycosyltransferase family 9 protein n=1 Tax=Argonema antarcticum TaxID=2942763 RepID=UPI002012A917|nr:glycosyltransferase family 9 protein [Argonema antarcticum]MCL1470615.1 glycosyltransferase family 9 protein [Argonema antarcticum A004/B2]